MDKETAVKMYKSMVALQIMDNIFYEAQRQGRISFYLTSTGEEAINIATAAALTSDDVILPQVRLARDAIKVAFVLSSLNLHFLCFLSSMTMVSHSVYC